MINTLLTLDGNDINRLALRAARQSLAGYRYENFRYIHAEPNNLLSPIVNKEIVYKPVDYSWTEICTVALAFRSILWEVKEREQLQSHPEDLLRRASCNMRAYEYRGYPRYLKFICRAFARQFSDFDRLPRRAFNWNHSDDGGNWLISGDGFASQRDYGARWFKVNGLYSYDEFGNQKDVVSWCVSEEVYGLFPYTDPTGKEKFYCLDEVYKAVPFDDIDEAKFFIAQLVDLLNTGYELKKAEDGWYFMIDKNQNDYINEIAAQLCRDTLAQAPVEEIRMVEEEAAKKRAEQLEKERIAREKTVAEANRRAEKDRKIDMRGGDHVYVIKFEPLSNNKDYIKIGHSVDVNRRSLEVKGGLDIHAACCTKAIPNSRALQIETQCHQHFDDRKKPEQREYFFVPYEEACAYLRSLVDEDLIVINE